MSLASIFGSAAAPSPTRPLAEAITVPADDACLARGLSEPVSTWLGRAQVRGDLAVEVTADEMSVGFVLRRSGEIRVERTLSPAPADCADRRAALGLAIAMALDAAVLEALAPPTGVGAGVGAEAGVEAGAEAGTEVGAERGAAPESEAEPLGDLPVAEQETPWVPVGAAEPAPGSVSSAVRLLLSAEVDALLGALPRSGFGGELGLSVGWVPWLDLRVAGGAAGGRSTPLVGGSVGTVLAWGAAELCPGRRVGWVRLQLCAGLGAGAVRASGRGFAESRVVVRPWVAVRTGGEVDVRLGDRIGLRVRGTLLTPLVDTRLDVRDEDGEVLDVREPAPVGGQVGLGVVVRVRGPWG